MAKIDYLQPGWAGLGGSKEGGAELGEGRRGFYFGVN